MAKNSVSDWDTTAANNTDVGGINIAENCPAANINNALREMMAQIADAGFSTAALEASDIGTSVQAYDAALDDISGLTPTDGNIIVGDGSNWVAESGSTALASLGAQAADAALTSLAGLSLAEGDILYATGADTLARLAKGTAGQVLAMNSGATAPEWASPAVALVVAEYATGVNGPSFPTSWGALDLNTERYDGIGISVASDQITFSQTGTYLIRANISPNNTSGGGRSGQVRLYNVTKNEVIATGQTMNTQTAAMGYLGVEAVAAIEAGDVIEFQGNSSGGSMLQAFGPSFGGHIGSQVTIQRIA